MWWCIFFPPPPPPPGRAAGARGGPAARAPALVEDLDDFLDLVPAVLDDALADPLQVADLLLLQLKIGIEAAVVELLLKRH